MLPLAGVDGRMSSNLFVALSKGSQGRLENFCTDALAWVLEHDLAARESFLHAVARGLPGAAQALQETVHLLTQADVLDIQTRRAISTVNPRNQQRSMFPDLSIHDVSSGACLLVEAKVWSRATGRKESTPDDEDATADAEDQRFVAQTEDYRIWLDENCPGRGVLCSLTVFDEPRLTEWCDVRLSWRDLASALRESTNVLASEFIAYLEEEELAHKDLPLTTADMKTLPNSAWEAIGVLLDDVTELLGELLSSQDVSIRLHPDWIHLRAGGPQELVVWTGSFALRQKANKLTVTPYLEVSGDRLIFFVGVTGDHINLPQARQFLPELRDNELEEAWDEVYVTIGLDLASLDLKSTRQKASEMAEVAAKQIRPLIAGALALTSH